MGNEGETLIVFQMPIGSVVQNGPDLMTDLCVDIDTNADVNVPLDIEITPVFAFGDAPTGGTPIIGTPVNSTIIPILYTYEKTVETFEGERPPGPSWPMTYRLVVDIANGQTIDNLQFEDILPSSLQMVGSLNIIGATQPFTTIQPSGPAPSTPGGTISLSGGSAVGTLGGEDLVIEYEAYIIDILDHTSCATQDVTNNSIFGIDVLTDESDVPVLARHATVEKSTANGASTIPGNTVTFNINFEVSDYDTLDVLTLTDLVPDGLITPGDGDIMLTVGGSPVTLVFALTPV